MVTAVDGVRGALRRFDFSELFVEELGWNHHRGALVVPVDGTDFALGAVAEKKGMVVYVCQPGAAGAIPERAIRRRIDKEVTKAAREHVIVFVDAGRTTQLWQWARREPGRPLAFREHDFQPGQKEEGLVQKLQALAVSLDEEEGLTIVEVAGRARQAFDVDRVTRRFYERFKSEHGQFLGFVEGITEQGDREWYASLMLNRLMFVYFIQKKGFLDGDVDYLRNRLDALRRQRREGEFHTFYRRVLLRLFHEGLGGQEGQREADFGGLLGTVPYLNGGLFDVHELEREYAGIEIADEAFERLFDFFDAYDWHLDERALRSDREINPDVLGYIFEKYVNQKQMGAYYTKEDITEYIAKNTIVPFLCDAAKKECAVAFRPEGALWGLLRENPDRYVYEAVRKGTDKTLPPAIAAGLDDVTQRGGWNRPAEPAYALPTETWREHVARRRRYEEAWGKLVDGGVTEIDDLITLNLDIRQFAQDAIADCEGPELLRAFWRAIQKITVLDPTCGSGAFLFAALNVLEPLYDACLERMQGFVDELDRSGEPHRPEKFRDFRETLARVGEHPNRRYFVLKQIVLHNLYGVDIMEEAVEICKLRLFLKLVSQVESAEQIEPLPDIDFNIRAGNTLVGFATLGEVTVAVIGKNASQAKIDFQGNVARIEEELEIVDRAFQRFHELQDKHGMDASEFGEAKAELQRRQQGLSGELTRYLAGEYAIRLGGEEKSDRFEEWKDKHQPFHWFASFHAIMKRGGFDAVIGNPPYISRAKVMRLYSLRDYETAPCTDIYASVLERCSNLLQRFGRTGMIVPLSLGFSGDFDVLRKLLYRRYSTNWFSSFARIPAALFSAEVRVRNTIHLGRKGGVASCCFSTVLHRWFEEARPCLFPNLSYTPFDPHPWKDLVPKSNSALLTTRLQCLLKENKETIDATLASRPTGFALHFKQTAYNWLCFCRELPPVYDAAGEVVPQTKFGTVHFSNRESRDLTFLFSNGKIMFSFWCLLGDDFDLTRWLFAGFPLDLDSIPQDLKNRLLRLVEPLEALMLEHTTFKLNAGKRIRPTISLSAVQLRIKATAYLRAISV